MLLLLQLEDLVRNAHEHTLELRRIGEVHVVDSFDNVLSGDALAGEPTAVQATVSLDATVNSFKLDVGLAVGGERDDAAVKHFAVLPLTLISDVGLELFVKTRILGAIGTVS